MEQDNTQVTAGNRRPWIGYAANALLLSGAALDSLALGAAGNSEFSWLFERGTGLAAAGALIKYLSRQRTTSE